MRKKQPRFILLLFTIATLLLLWFLLTPRTPSYQGRSLSSWLAQLDDGDHNSSLSWSPWSKHTHGSNSQAVAANAIRQMGTNTIPILLSDLTKKDPESLIKLENYLRKLNWFSSSWLSNHIEQQKNLRHQAALALDALGPDAKPALPQLIKAFYAGEPKQATIAMAAIGPEGWTELTKAITNSNELLAINGIWGMGMHAASVPGTVECLIQNLTNTISGGIGPLSAWALGEIKHPAEQIVPALTTALQSPNKDTRWSSADSLGKFGHQATNALPALLKALEEDPDSNVRTHATNAIKKISPSTLK
jgi:HEAT repeat protein